jgi:hypothetical protein
MHHKANKLAHCTDMVHNLSRELKQMTRWTTKIYPKGIKPVRFSPRTKADIDCFIDTIEDPDNQSSMSPCHYYAASC